MNNKLTLEWAEAFAGRVLAVAANNEEDQIREAYKMAFSRFPSVKEVALAKSFFAEQAQIISQSSGSSVAPPPAESPTSSISNPKASAVVDFCHMLLNSNEFVYLN